MRRLYIFQDLLPVKFLILNRRDLASHKEKFPIGFFPNWTNVLIKQKERVKAILLKNHGASNIISRFFSTLPQFHVSY